MKLNEIRFNKIFSDGQIPGFVHLYVGEEAVATGHANSDDILQVIFLVMDLQKVAI